MTTENLCKLCGQRLPLTGGCGCNPLVTPSHLSLKENPVKLYGVSSGNGNSGVSHMFADYYVRTNDPWRLAELACVSDWKEGVGQAWAMRHMEIDGDSKYVISVCLYDSPCEESEDGEYPELTPEQEAEGLTEENLEDGRNWNDNNGAYAIYEIFPAKDSETRDRPVYESLESCFESGLLALVKASD